MQQALRKIYFTPSDTRDAGYIETEHFGVRFPHRSSYVDLTCITQRWLRDLLWDHIADVLRSPTCPRSAQPVDFVRRAAAELCASLEAEAPGGGHDPTVLRGEHVHRFVADLRNRERLGLTFHGQARLDGRKSKVTENSRRLVFNYGRSLLRGALDSGAPRESVWTAPSSPPCRSAARARPAAATPSPTRSPAPSRTRPTCSNSPTATTRATGA
ncbi:hypothetical protein KMT30_12245 [Streptomyces sp. IBSBF 2953]|nr:hypothetical protein [Streptomyces hayashii]